MARSRDRLLEFAAKLRVGAFVFELGIFEPDREGLAAVRFGTQHHETTISAEQLRDFLPGYWHMEERVCEPPAVALYYLARLASEHVKAGVPPVTARAPPAP